MTEPDQLRVRQRRESMSKRLQKHKSFISLLLETHRDQRKALLLTLDKEQVLVLAEIILNLNQLPLNKTKKSLLLKFKHIIKHITDPKLPWTKKRAVIEKSYSSVWHIISAGKFIFTSLIK